MGSHHSKQESKLTADIAGFETKFSTLDSYISYQITQIRNAELTDLENKLEKQ